jgi:hypothetical protein
MLALHLVYSMHNVEIVYIGAVKNHIILASGNGCTKNNNNNGLEVYRMHTDVWCLSVVPTATKHNTATARTQDCNMQQHSFGVQVCVSSLPQVCKFEF